MSWFSNIGKAINKAYTDTGHFIGSVADNKYTKLATAAALAATGVGAPAAAAIMGAEGLAGGALKKGGNLGTALTGAGTGALEGYGAGKAGGMIRGALSANTEGNIFQRLGGAARDVGGDVVSDAAKASGVSNPDGSTNWGQLAKLGLAGASLYGQKQSTDRANAYFNSQQQMRQNMMNQAQQDYASRQPLRDAAFSKLGSMISSGPSTSGVFNGFLNKERSAGTAG